ncbi:MAG: DHH family phosphoesterase [Bacteroidales bacterium]|nr:DHH family phosphoesterase [Bacteroidales bacterium]
MKTFDFSKLKELLPVKKNILITAHSNPDGDALGSSLALYHFLIQLGHNVYIIVPDEYPYFLAWMPGQEQILIYEHNKNHCDSLFNSAELIFSLDYNAPNRIGKATESFKKAACTKILIDHHVQPEITAYDLVYSTTETSSTSELIYDMIVSVNPNLFNKVIAECLYVGIMTDTGSFSFDCNSEKTYRVVAELFKQGIDGAHIHRLVYDTYSESRIRMLGYCLSEKLKIIPKYCTAYISLTIDELNRYQYIKGNTEGIVNYPLSIKGIKFAALFTERKDKVRISFRSVGDFSVNAFARKHFEGGGHRNAAGGDSYTTMDKTLEKFERLLEEYEEYLKT